MSVVISNVSTHADLSGPNDYVVHFSGKPVIAQFSHVRSEGLAACLRRAADAVEASEHPDRARLPRQDDEIRKAALEEATASARLARLHTLLLRVRWHDLGIPAMEEADTQQALIEVTQYLLTDALDEALSRALSQKGDEADG